MAQLDDAAHIIKFDPKQLKDVQRVFSDWPSAVKGVVKFAIREAEKKGRTIFARRIGADLGVAQKHFKKYIWRSKQPGAVITSWDMGRIRVGWTGIAFHLLKPKQTEFGVEASVGGVTEFVPHAFIAGARGKGSKKVVFRREFLAGGNRYPLRFIRSEALSKYAGAYTPEVVGEAGDRMMQALGWKTEQYLTKKRS